MRRVLLWLGLTVVTVAAVAASFSTLAGLAAFTGWGHKLSWLLPASLDALGMTACLVWLDRDASNEARANARWMTWIAAGLSIIGNGAGHLASTGHIQQGLLLVLLVGAVPPAALTTTVHLIVRVTEKAVPVPDTAPVPAEATIAVWTWRGPSPAVAPLIGTTEMFEQFARTLAVTAVVPAEPEPTPVPVKTAPPARRPQGKPKAVRRPPVKSGPESSEVDDVLMQRAQHIADEFEKEHGKPPSRDDLKTELGIGTTKATAVAAALKKKREAA